MRAVTYFVENKKLGNLLLEFPISRECLYHYTSENAAAGISNGELWMTRADCFLDEAEIQYGEMILEQAAHRFLKVEARDSFIRLLSNVCAGLNLTYVTSFSQEFDNEYLKNNYGKHVIEFGVLFPDQFKHQACHTVPTEQGSFAVHFIDQHYRSFEGCAIYDEGEQVQLASKVCDMYCESHQVR